MEALQNMRVIKAVQYFPSPLPCKSRVTLL